MAYRGIYSGVAVTPGTPLDRLLMLLQTRRERARVQETLVLAMAALGADDVQRAFQTYHGFVFPGKAVQDESQREAMQHLLENWDAQQQRFGGILEKLLRFRQQRAAEKQT